MIKKSIGFACLYLLLLFSVAVAAEVDLTMEDLIKQTLETNFDVQINKYNPRISEEEVKGAEAEFDPVIRFNTGLSKEQRASSSTFDDPVTYDTNAIGSIGIDKKFQNGVRGSVDYSTSRYTTSASYFSLSPEYDHTATLVVTQPLLKNRGRKVNMKDIDITTNNNKIAQLKFEHDLISIISDAQVYYWDYYHSLEALKVKQESLDLAQKFHEDSKLKVTAGAIPEIFLLQARSEVSSREEDVIIEENNSRNNRDKLVNFVYGSLQVDDNYTLKHHPTFEELKLDENSLVKTAYENRPDFRVAKLDVENSDINLVYAENQKLPTVDLSATVSLNGLGGSLKKGALNQFAGSYGKAMGRMFSGNYYTAGLELSVLFPWGLKKDKAVYGLALHKKKQTLFALLKTEKKIQLEVRTALRNFTSLAKRYDTTKEAKDIAHKTLKAEQRKYELGISTNYAVLQVQRDYIDAFIKYIRAVMEYQKTKIRLYEALGVTLTKNNIKLADVKFDQDDQ